MDQGITKSSFIQYSDDQTRSVEGAVPTEERIMLNVNGIELVGLMCTPVLLEELAIGFLYTEGLITGMDEVVDVRVCGSGRCVDVWLTKDIETPTIRIVTTGCSGGTTFDTMVEAQGPVSTNISITPGQVRHLMRLLYNSTTLYQQAKGIHASALSDGETLYCAAEDVGRHNTVDKLAGSCLRQEMTPQGLIMLTTGRVSSEMLGKAARMDLPVVISRTSPTSLSVELARAWGITLIGYARGTTFRCYSSPERIVANQAPG
jgi:FdhD protein